jgi:tellurite resistance protein
MNQFNSILSSENSKYNFLKGLIYLAKADGQVDSDEKAFFIETGRQLNLAECKLVELDELFDAEEYAVELEFENKVQGNLLLQEGVQLCFLDGKYDVEEKAMIAYMGELLLIEEKKIIEIEEWVMEGVEWRERGYSILKEGE